MFELDYKPVVNEVPPVAEAIRLMRQVTASAPDVDTRWTVGYAEGVAYAMGIFDPWCDDHGDPVLWSTCAAMHDARPASDERAPLRRKAAWFEYIRMAAELSVVAS